MGFLDLFRKSRVPQGGVVTACRMWKCPNCGTLLQKGSLGTIWSPGEPLSRVAGTGSCGCGASFPQAEIYRGRYDHDEAPREARTSSVPDTISVVVFCIRSARPPSQPPREYCRSVLGKKYARCTLANHYIVGFLDDLSANEALALYKENVRHGSLPDLGSQIDSFGGKGPDGSRVVALVFA